MIDFCENIRKKQLRDFLGASGIKNLTQMAKDMYNKILGETAEKVQEEVTKQILEDINTSQYFILDQTLSKPSQEVPLPNVKSNKIINAPGFRSLEEVQKTLSRL